MRSLSIIFIKFNADNPDSNVLITSLAKDCGFSSAYEMADEITAIKKRMGMVCTLSQFGCTTQEQIDELTKKSMSPLMQKNPVPLTEEDIRKMYIELM